ncbi:hypothetical protein M2256_000989 [Lactococcus lactis]|uniref:Uncharacterized protein n=1 Tax=Lactococcus lactis TaxID=1358 RepID=A0AAW5TPR3_9LACT|nr:hypothetical protein [Lactococcus lactis]
MNLSVKMLLTENKKVFVSEKLLTRGSVMTD